MPLKGYKQTKEHTDKMRLNRKGKGLGNKNCVGRIPWNKNKKLPYMVGNKFALGKTAWNKGIKTVSNGVLEKYVKENGTWNKGLNKKVDKRLNYYRPTSFKKGRTSERKGKEFLQIKGKNHYLWNPNREYVLANSDRHTVEHCEWSKKVKNKDSWKCKINDVNCFGRLEAHHIYPWSKFSKLRYEINNGITLCKFHHPRKEEDIYKLIPFYLKNN